MTGVHGNNICADVSGFGRFLSFFFCFFFGETNQVSFQQAAMIPRHATKITPNDHHRILVSVWKALSAKVRLYEQEMRWTSGVLVTSH